ncbi:hypothetical protein J3E73DRAFT_262967 [Bipolaris maydis]|nr:hypothetical protein J3E73DRAFT_262967 [Bipolaris maydis]
MALQLMQHLCCLTDTSSANSMPVMGGAPRPPPLRLRSLMDKCSKATATISAILHGDSSHDAYFLAVVCLTMSKVLDAYVTASRTLGTTNHHHHQHGRLRQTQVALLICFFFFFLSFCAFVPGPPGFRTQ